MASLPPWRGIRIGSTPQGAAPIAIRQAWIGLTLPLQETAPSSPQTMIVETEFRDPANRLDALKLRLGFKRPTAIWQAYTVQAAGALRLLESHSPDAARWWRQNTPWLYQPAQVLAFDADCCELVFGERAPANEP
ncbi:hypothetical protein [Labrys sp. ZIDIC5]|uniref:hypothetical protein n=1 Tax=Labrys sedimenti TaxID=3106036 RepID=UPI002ACA3BEE|nr:hypothetical protein [Labrys sp. ZIDIC5]MDZ5450911.1 hypothetical protein [Labrys sp. ZIDIC5]